MGKGERCGVVAAGILAAVWVLDAYSAGTGSVSQDMMSEQAYLAEVPVVLSASRMLQPISETPGPVTVIDREMIEASGFLDIADLFRLVPGFYVGYFNGHDPTVAHGLADRYFGRVQVLVDGRSVYSPLWGTVDWTSLPLAMENIERIEVVRGPDMANYGANAFLGVINIITRHAQEDRGTTISAAAGQPGLRQALVRHGGDWGNLNYRITAGSRSDGGFPGLNDSRRVDLFTARGDYQLSTSDTLLAQVGYSHGKLGVGQVDDLFDPYRDETKESHYQQLRWQRSTGADNELSLNLYHSYQSLSDSFGTPAFVDSGSGIYVFPAQVSNDARGERYEAELQHNLTPRPDLRLVWGAAVRLDRIWAPIYLGTSNWKDSHLQRLFGSAEYRFAPRWTLNVGAMSEHNDVTGSDTSPRAALIYHIEPRQTVRLAISKGLRTPTLLEDDADFNYRLRVRLPDNTVTTVAVPRFLSGGGLASEWITSRELGYMGEFPRFGLSLDVRVYREDLRDLIVPSGAVAPYRFVNAYSATIDGVDTHVDWRFGPESRLWFSHAYSHIVSDDPNLDLNRATPVQIYSMLWSQGFGGSYRGSLGYYGVREMEPQGDGDPVPAYHRLDLRLAKKMAWGGRRAEAALVVQNLLHSYEDFKHGNVFQRRAFVSLKFDL